MTETERAEELLDGLNPDTAEVDHTEDLRAIAEVATPWQSTRPGSLRPLSMHEHMDAAGPASASHSACPGRRRGNDSRARVPFEDPLRAPRQPRSDICPTAATP